MRRQVGIVGVQLQRSATVQGLAQLRVLAAPFEASSCRVSTEQLLAWNLSVLDRASHFLGKVNSIMVHKT